MSLVAWYPLIDGSLENKGLDNTPLSLHGTVPFTNGRVRTAPTFSADGSNWLGHSMFEAKTNFSAFCWVKFNNSTTRQDVFAQCRSDAAKDGWGVTRDLSGYIRFNYGNLTFQLSAKVKDNTWAHVGLTVTENGTITGYVNGKQVYQGTATDLPAYAAWKGFCLGQLGGFAGLKYYPLNGQLQDFRYYDHCLSPKEVKEIARGLCLHLPLKGTNARPNLFKNSAVMFDRVGHYNLTLSTAELVFDETAPCGINGKVLKLQSHRDTNYPYNYCGTFYIASESNMDKLEIGKTYCVSVWIKCDTPGQRLLQGLAEGQKVIKGSNDAVSTEWKRYYVIFVAQKETHTTCFYLHYSLFPQTGNVNLYVCCPKLELLSPTPYIPNVDDTQYSDYVLDYEPDCSGNEFDATKHGDLTTSDSNGRYNTAVAFNGTNTYLQGLAPTNSECKEFTIATWVKLNNNTTNQTIYTCRTVIGAGLVLFYLGANHGIRLDDGTANAVFPNSTLEPNKWYHIAVTRDATSRKLYINGSFVSSATTTGALANMGTMYQVGESNAQTTLPIGNFLNGSLSDLRLYTSVLSADDIKELYETSVSIDNNGNLHAYEFDEGFDQSIKKVGVMTSPKFTETTDVNMVKGNTNTTKLIEV